MGGQNASLSEGVWVLISIPRALSPGTNKALAPHWTEHTASLPHRRGTLWELKSWGQGAVTKKSRIQKRKEPRPTLQKRPPGLGFIARGDGDSPRQPFLKQSPPGGVAFPLASPGSRVSSRDSPEPRPGPRAPHTRLRAGEGRNLQPSVVFGKGKQGGGRTNIHHLGRERREARDQPPGDKVLQGLQQKPSRWEYNYTSISVGSGFNRTASQWSPAGPPKPVNLRQCSRAH